MLALAAGLAFVPAARSAVESEPSVSFVVLRENGTGSTAQAQPHIDKLMQRIGSLTHWNAQGKYLRDRSDARPLVSAGSTQFALLSLAAFLDLRDESGLDVLGTVDVAAAGGRRYHLVSTVHKDVAGCRGQSLASDHLDDVRFIERVVARGAFKLDEFKRVDTRRPMQTVKAALRGEAACALIDDAQLDAAKKLENGAALHVAWSSAELPPMALVATRGATVAQRATLKQKLADVCKSDGAAICGGAGIRALQPASEKAYAAVVAAYGPK